MKNRGQALNRTTAGIIGKRANALRFANNNQGRQSFPLLFLRRNRGGRWGSQGLGLGTHRPRTRTMPWDRRWRIWPGGQRSFRRRNAVGGRTRLVLAHDHIVAAAGLGRGERSEDRGKERHQHSCQPERPALWGRNLHPLLHSSGFQSTGGRRIILRYKILRGLQGGKKFLSRQKGNHRTIYGPPVGISPLRLEFFRPLPYLMAQPEALPHESGDAGKA